MGTFPLQAVGLPVANKLAVPPSGQTRLKVGTPNVVKAGFLWGVYRSVCLEWGPQCSEITVVIYNGIRRGYALAGMEPRASHI